MCPRKRRVSRGWKGLRCRWLDFISPFAVVQRDSETPAGLVSRAYDGAAAGSAQPVVVFVREQPSPPGPLGLLVLNEAFCGSDPFVTARSPASPSPCAFVFS